MTRLTALFTGALLVLACEIISFDVQAHTGVSVEHADTEKEYLVADDHRHRPLGFETPWEVTLPENSRRIGVITLSFYDRDLELVGNPEANAFSASPDLFNAVKFSKDQDPDNEYGLELNPALSAQNAVQVRLNGRLDYETATSHTITVTGRDQYDDPKWNPENTEGLWNVTTTVTLNVSDIDETVNRVPYFQQGRTSVHFPENTSGGTEIGQEGYRAVDDDLDNVTLTIGGQDARFFELSEFSWLHTAADAIFDYETRDTYSITIIASDGNGGSATMDVTLHVWDVAENAGSANQPPQFSDASLVRGVVENYIGHFGPAIVATDPNEADVLNYSISGGANAHLFSIHSSTGVLHTVQNLDYESASSHSIVVAASDNYGATTTVNITVNVTDDLDDNTPEPPTVTTTATRPPATTGGGGGGSNNRKSQQTKRTPPPAVPEGTESESTDTTESDSNAAEVPVRVNAVLENPGPDSPQSGISVISGWACEAEEVSIDINGEPSLAAYGTERLDTADICGDTDNGFSLLFNWNHLGEGEHEVVAFVDGVELGRATVRVTTLGHEFLRGVEKEVSFTGFPSAGDDITLQWQQSLQNFVIRGTAGASGGHAGAPPKILENPQPGAFVSGIGAISGWVCDASTIEIEFDNDAVNRWQAGYGTLREDTYGVCGDTNNGFGLLYNWNNLGDGIHTVRAFADGVEFASATVVVTTFGEEFLRGASGTFTVSDFPQPGINVDLLWQQSQQNFAIAGVSGDGSEGVRTGLDALKAGDMREANNAFRQATIDDPADTTAGLYHAVTRIATKAIDTPQLRELARRSGMSLGGDTSDVCLVDFPLPEEIPSGAPQTAEIFNALRDVLAPEIDAALTTLNGLPNSVEVPFVLGNLPSCLSMLADGFVVEIDRSDVQVLTATLQAIRGLLEILAAYDVDVGLQALKTPTLQDILTAEPTTLPLVSSARLSSAQTFFDQAFASASQAISSVLAETDSQEDDVLVITPGDVADAQTIKRVLDLVRQSLGETTVLPTDIGLDDPERLNLSVLFSGRIGALRPLLLAPGGTFSDPTFGGIAPDFTQQDIEAYTPENFLTWLGDE